LQGFYRPSLSPMQANSTMHVSTYKTMATINSMLHRCILLELLSTLVMSCLWSI
jgi:hypothetical protein